MAQTSSHDRLPDDVQSILDDLRARIRKYVIVEGVSLVVVVICGLFWLSYLTDWAYFKLSRLELPGWLRTAFLIVMLCSLVGGAVTWIAARLMRRIRSRALALVLEKRFPELDDRLITAVELAENGQGDDTPFTSAMQRRTITDAAQTARGLDLESVFDRRPLKRALTGALMLLVSIAGLGIADAASVGRWYSAFVLGRDNYWDPFRQSALEVGIVAQPGDRFQQLTTDSEYKHPRGADLVVRVSVPDDKVVPEQVTLHYRTVGETGSSEGRVTMTQVDDQTFRHVLSRAMDDHQLWVVGGDFTNRLPYRVDVVDPPRIDAIALDCDYPAYTGMNAFADQQVPVQGTQVSLPIGTRFVMHAEANKPLLGVRVRSPLFDLSFAKGSDSDADSTSDQRSAIEDRLVIKSTETDEVMTYSLSSEEVQHLISEDGLSFELPLVVSPNAAEQLAGWDSTDAFALPVPPDIPLQFELHDADDIRSEEPVRLTINGIADLPPVIETRLKGIGRSITRLARIPVEGTIADDYGVSTSQFGFRVDEAEQYEFAELSEAPSGEKSFPLGGSDPEATEPFNVRPLELSLGQKLTLSVFATDADDVTGPHESHGEVYTFRVVSNEELLAILYDKELNLRLRFEQIISEVTEARDDLSAHREISREVERLRAIEQPTAEQREQLTQSNTSLAVCADRRLQSLRKNQTESQAIEESFRDIRAEMVNNRVDTSTALERIDDGILTPLHQINEIDYPEADQNIALFRLAHEQGQSSSREIQSAIDSLNTMLNRMEGILIEMRRRETYNEIVKLYQSLLEKEQELHNRTKKAHIDSLFGE
ncbi:MAG: hypothetical protein KDA93_02030 [Planctomycetaceae bacterium]|nr:hypothetical protein [Planctomycetaceae bacterium]